MFHEVFFYCQTFFRRLSSGRNMPPNGDDTIYSVRRENMFRAKVVNWTIFSSSSFSAFLVFLFLYADKYASVRLVLSIKKKKMKKKKRGKKRRNIVFLWWPFFFILFVWFTWTLRCSSCFYFYFLDVIFHRKTQSFQARNSSTATWEEEEPTKEHKNNKYFLLWLHIFMVKSHKANNMLRFSLQRQRWKTLN